MIGTFSDRNVVTGSTK